MVTGSFSYRLQKLPGFPSVSVPLSKFVKVLAHFSPSSRPLLAQNFSIVTRAVDSNNLRLLSHTRALSLPPRRAANDVASTSAVTVAWRRQQEVGEKCAFGVMALEEKGGGIKGGNTLFNVESTDRSEAKFRLPTLVSLKSGSKKGIHC
jgi:hypothetical protein